MSLGTPGSFCSLCFLKTEGLSKLLRACCFPALATQACILLETGSSLLASPPLSCSHPLSICAEGPLCCFSDFL